MGKMVEIPGRLHSVAKEMYVSGANEIYDDEKQMRQSEYNAQTDSRLNAVESDINTQSSGIKDRLETLENEVSFEGEIQVENTPQGIVSGSGKVPTANAVAGRIVPLEHVITNEEMDEVLGGELPVYLTDRDGNAVLGEDNKPIEII